MLSIHNSIAFINRLRTTNCEIIIPSFLTLAVSTDVEYFYIMLKLVDYSPVVVVVVLPKLIFAQKNS